ncbi:MULTISPECIES: D-alanine--D-alanine ligase family protein [unclassified Mesorhizobium]|uniref:D-alanine--D-alanine ligase family protein n=1 Tax=unclassified Mesorhizobium TaxID=325217 RepID=UPI000F75DC7A|nr:MULTISPECIES: D-alanine--D-alanine ligase family protein [unclassified Mesorhizobium]AZO65013.1 D-alanine--D-alanine ligase [Mesorhizobium sp. M6A.T.Cr.TU.016.01.1.1]RUU29223.1 D-alanine--D-alanine ligase [Mesorhizobium sp. M6A.T.Ce.TU.016.01.1.1]RUU42629.1 D-alanine--D-alanine ligase [Mesorhizobium sp. M6A.T.Ce.TU.002.03.1.1]RWP56219.1 MAG: D-alanine--D-alanine ligase [Mesorhizobium sp.]RWQ83474.1 MAG: D-alanine--D-alanine ligase [Mesorhizobium sp.]
MADTSKRLRIAVLFGGRSAEHDVSVLSATNVMRALEPAKYDAVPVFVTREGQWLLSSFEDGTLAKPSTGTEVCLVPGGQGRVLAIPTNGTPHELPAIDILFPALHGLHGEDGSVQGLAEVARVPLAGCGILGSAAALDKDIAKRLLNEAGLPTARSVTIHHGAAPAFAELESVLGLPLFIKPARQGSSVGVSKVSAEKDYEAALTEGFGHDRKLLAEEFIRGREIECSVLEDTQGGLFVSRPGEIMPAQSHGFYSYDAKYIDEHGAALKVPAELPQEIEGKIRAMAAKAFRAVGCDGMARVDFFVTPDMRVLINELNTIPGFTDISMYSKAMAASGVSYSEIIDRLVAHGLARAGRSA